MSSDLPSKLDTAWQRRVPLHTSANTTAYRLINRSGDGFPDLAVDRYGHVLVAHVYSGGIKVSPPRAVLQTLADRVGAQAVYVKYRPVQGLRRNIDTEAPKCPGLHLFLGRLVVYQRVVKVEKDGFNHDNHSLASNTLLF